MDLPSVGCCKMDSFESRSRKPERAHFTQGDDFFVMCGVSLTRLHFLCSTQRKRSKRKCAGGKPLDPMDGTSAADRLRHERTRSARRPKTRCLAALKQFGRSFWPLVMQSDAWRAAKIPSRATPLDSAGAALAYRERGGAQFIFRSFFLCETTFLHTESCCAAGQWEHHARSHAPPSSVERLTEGQGSARRI